MRKKKGMVRGLETVAKAMLAKGMSVEEIVSLTGLSEEQVRAL